MTATTDPLCRRCQQYLYSGFNTGLCGSCTRMERDIDTAVTRVCSFRPELMKPKPKTEWERAWSNFSDLMGERLEAGREVFGDKWLDKPEGMHIDDIIEELVDAGNYCAFLVYKLQRIKASLEMVDVVTGCERVEKTHTEGTRIPGTHCA